MNGRAIPGAEMNTLWLTKISANECDPGTNYLRQPRYHCIRYTRGLINDNEKKNCL